MLASLSQQILLSATVLEVETLAARKALELAIAIGVNRVILEGDCEILINALQSNNHSKFIINYNHHMCENYDSCYTIYPTLSLLLC